MKHIYQAIKKRLQDNIEALQEVEWYMRQYQQTGENTMYVTPAAYIEFRPISFESYRDGIQQANIEVVVHAVSESVYDNDTRFTDASINHLGLVDDIFKTLHGWGAQLSDVPDIDLEDDEADPTILNSMTRTQYIADHGFSDLIVTRQTFSAVAFIYIDRSEISHNLSSIVLSSPPITVNVSAD